MIEGNDRRKEGSKHSEIHSSLVMRTPTILVWLSWEISQTKREVGFLVLFFYTENLSCSKSAYGVFFCQSACKM